METKQPYETRLDERRVNGGLDRLTNLVNTLSKDERYSFINEGNSMSLDHILVSQNLTKGASFEVVHINVKFADNFPSQAIAHEPIVASVTISLPFLTFLLTFYS